jgi:WD40 repeat protein
MQTLSVQTHLAGATLLSGSDDTRVCVWDVESRECRAVVDTGHSANIFCVRYLPNTGADNLSAFWRWEQVIVSCSVTACSTHRYRHASLTARTGDGVIASCAGDSQVRVHDLQTGTTTVFR